MREAYAEIQALGGAVLVVSFAPPAQVAAYLERGPQPFPVVSDPQRRAYRAFGLEATTFGVMLRPGVVARYLGLVLRGWMPWRSARGDDLLQLGGDFVLDAAGRLRYAHASAEPTDRPSAAALIAAVRDATRPGQGQGSTTG